MQAYARFLRAHNTPAIAVVTEMYFDEDSDVPKLFFKAVRPLSEEELEQVVELRDAPETKKAIDLTVYQTDTGEKPEESKPAKLGLFAEAEEEAPKEAAKVEPVEEDDEEEQPKRVVKKSKPAPKEDDDDLSDIVSAWDDE